MRTKRITLVFFVTMTSIFSLFLMGQFQYQINTPHLLVSNASPPPLIAKEEEVNQFFDNYAVFYKKKMSMVFFRYSLQELSRIIRMGLQRSGGYIRVFSIRAMNFDTV